MNKLAIYRKEMDKINNGLLDLISKRLKVSKKIGKYKKANKIKIFDKKREKQMFEELAISAKKKKLDPNYTLKIFKNIVDYSKNVQK